MKSKKIVYKILEDFVANVNKPGTTRQPINESKEIKAIDLTEGLRLTIPESEGPPTKGAF